jgi:hypothetical protein
MIALMSMIARSPRSQETRWADTVELEGCDL